MPEPVMLTIMKRLSEEIEARADMEGMVFRGRSDFGPAMGGPQKMVSIMVDGNATDDWPQQTQDGQTRLVSLPLILIGYDVQDLGNPDNPTDATTIMAAKVSRAVNAIKIEGAATASKPRNYMGMGRIVDDIKVGQFYPYPEFANENTGCAFWLMPITITFVDVGA